MKVRINGITKPIKRIAYEDELEITKLLRSLRLYNMRAYKQLIFNKTLDLKEIDSNEYSIDLYTDKKFKLVYGDVRIITELKEDVLIIKQIEPCEFFKQGHQVMLNVYKGVPVLSNKEVHKIHILEKMGKF